MAAIMDCNEMSLEIGVLEECDNFLLESRYFPSKMGGHPAWLNLKELPKDLKCGLCSNPCIFLCQIYAPIDDIPHCHHRTIFLFICPNPACCKPGLNQNLKAFRCQLPVKNDFYPVEDPTEEESWHPECKVQHFSKICVMCGNPAPYDCGKCSSVSYCSKEHQVTHWKLYNHKSYCCTGNIKMEIDCQYLFPQFEITIDKPLEEIQIAKTEEDALNEYNDLLMTGKTGTLENETAELSLLEQSAIKSDKYFDKYKKCIDRCPEQVLRYDRGGTPLFVVKPDFDESSIPRCCYCDGERQFEFQILSTLLNEVVNKDPHSQLDFGTLLVYTCKNNCEQGPAYKLEHVYKQDFERSEQI